MVAVGIYVTCGGIFFSGHLPLLMPSRRVMPIANRPPTREDGKPRTSYSDSSYSKRRCRRLRRQRSNPNPTPTAGNATA